jgi:hypothetical protein
MMRLHHALRRVLREKFEREELFMSPVAAPRTDEKPATEDTDSHRDNNSVRIREICGPFRRRTNARSDMAAQDRW